MDSLSKNIANKLYNFNSSLITILGLSIKFQIGGKFIF